MNAWMNEWMNSNFILEIIIVCNIVKTLEMSDYLQQQHVLSNEPYTVYIYILVKSINQPTNQ